MIAGIMADVTGDYRAGLTILALLAGIGSFFFPLFLLGEASVTAAAGPSRVILAYPISRSRP